MWQRYPISIHFNSIDVRLSSSQTNITKMKSQNTTGWSAVLFNSALHSITSKMAQKYLNSQEKMCVFTNKD